MQFLKSLFCFTGFDNRSRFLAICSAIYVIFIMFTSAFENGLIFQTILLIFFSIIIGLTSLRRLHDAKLNRNWSLVPSLSFAFIAAIIIFQGQSSSYYLLLISALCNAVLLTYPSKNKLSFILGYAGPVDLKEYQDDNSQNRQSSVRIEPSLFSDNNVNLSSNTGASLTLDKKADIDFTESTEVENNSYDIGELIRLTLLNNRKAQIISVSIVCIIIISIVSSQIINNLTEQPEEITPQKKLLENSLTTTVNRSNPLPMPDNYTLYLSDHGGISINWQADEVMENILWSQLSAEGDQSCQEISFNKGDAIRTITVQVVETNGVKNNYYADFSPLDSKALIQSLAFRGSFTLCGYDFSLKGSQAALGQNSSYAQWVDY